MYKRLKKYGDLIQTIARAKKALKDANTMQTIIPCTLVYRLVEALEGLK